MNTVKPNRLRLIVIATWTSLLVACDGPEPSRRAPYHDEPATRATTSTTKDRPTAPANTGMLELDAYPVDRRLGGPFVQPDPEDLDQNDFRLVDAIRHSSVPLVPNCAGHHHAMVVGCGTSCRRLCFFDLRDGRYVSEMTVVFSCGMSGWIDDPLETRDPRFDVDSRIVMVPCIVGDVEGCHFFEVADRILVPMATVPWNSSWNSP